MSLCNECNAVGTSLIIFKIFQWIGNEIQWIGPAGPVAEGDPKNAPQGIFFPGALRYRYKRDLRKEPRVTASFASLKRVKTCIIRNVTHTYT